MKKIRQRNEDFTNQFNRLTLKDIINHKDQPFPVKELVKKIYGRSTFWQENYITRMLELPPIKPARFVWHIGAAPWYHGCSDVVAFSIATEGLKSSLSKYNVVFANNNPHNIERFFPFIDDSSYSPMDTVVDYWRIDTHAFKADWYIDLNMGSELYEPTDYICTPSDIPAYALRLFRCPEELSYHPYSQSFLDYSNYDTRVLVPDDRVNWWIRRKQSAA